MRKGQTIVSGRIIGGLHRAYHDAGRGISTDGKRLERVIVYVVVRNRDFRREWANIVHAYNLVIGNDGLPVQELGDFVAVYDVLGIGADLLALYDDFMANKHRCVRTIEAALDVRVPWQGIGASPPRKRKIDSTMPIIASNRHAGIETIANGLDKTKRRI